MGRAWPIIACLSLALGIILDAYGAHALQAHLMQKQYQNYELAVEYQMFYSISLLIVGIISNGQHNLLLNLIAMLMLGGMLLFCGSLYLSVVFGLSWPTLLTPMGGVILIVCWLLLALYFWRYYAKQ